MTKRLQVLLDDEELAEIQRLAKRRHQTTAAWVRDALRVAREADRPDATRKLAVVRDALTHTFPTGSIDDLLAEIEQGYQSADIP